MEKENHEIKAATSEQGNKSNIIPMPVEFKPSERTALELFNIEKAMHPINRKKLILFLLYFEDQLDDFTAVSKNGHYQTVKEQIVAKTTEELSEKINDFDADHPSVDQITALAIYKTLVSRNYIVENS